MEAGAMNSSEAPIVVTVVDDVIFVGGEIDLMTAPELDECLGAAEGDVRLDMSAVTFVDSVGLSVLIAHHGRRLRDGEALRIVDMSQPVRRLLEITGLLPIFVEGTAQPA
jgi:anti-sigma B factor antagonist